MAIAKLAPMAMVFRPSRRRNNLLILFILVLIYFFILYEFLLPRQITLEEGSLRSWFLHDSDDTSATVLHHRNSSRVLLVSSLFMLSKSKHSKEEYSDWLKRFLQPITTEIYFYTSPDLASIVQAARGEGLPITIDANYNTSFDVPPLKGREGWYNKMHGMDREKSYHSPELYSVWNAKPFFVDNAIRVMESKGKTYDYVFWSDGGSFREMNVYRNWPDPNRLDEVWHEGSRLSGTKTQDLLFFGIQHPPYIARDWKEDMGPIDTDFSQGKQIMGFLKRLKSNDFIFHQGRSLVVPRVQWLGGHVHSTPITTTTATKTFLSAKIKPSSTPFSFYSTNVSLPYGEKIPRHLPQILDAVSNPSNLSTVKMF